MKDYTPLVCICIPTYNAASTIVDMLNSILDQTYKNIVIHISDNASTDNTVELIEALNNPKIRLFRHINNVGGEGNFNRCIKYAVGDYTAIYHSDDLYDPEIVAKQVELLQTNNEVGAVFTEAYLINEKSKRIGCLSVPKSLSGKFYLYDFEDLFKDVLRYSNFLICPSAMLRTNIYKQHLKLWDGVRFKSSSDLDVWMRVSQISKIGIIPQKLIHYRISSTQGSQKLRSRTIRSDLFLVLDDYIIRNEVSSKLTAEDYRNYKWLDNSDRLVRAVNHYLIGEIGQAKSLTTGLIGAVYFFSAFQSRRRFITLLGIILLRTLIFLNITILGSYLLTFIKRVLRK